MPGERLLSFVGGSKRLGGKPFYRKSGSGNVRAHSYTFVHISTEMCNGKKKSGSGNVSEERRRKNMEEDSVEEEDVIEEDEQDAMVALHFAITLLQKERKELLA